MNKQKYYVKLKKEIQATGVTFADMRLYLDKNGAFDYYYFAHPFTKSELAEIKDGAFYKVLCVESFTAPAVIANDWMWSKELNAYEWKNQLIELVPVEVEE